MGELMAERCPTSDPGGSAYGPASGRGEMEDHVQHHGGRLRFTALTRQSAFCANSMAQLNCNPVATVEFFVRRKRVASLRGRLPIRRIRL